MEIKGIVVQNLGVESGTGKSSGKEWKKGSVVIQTEGQYPKKILLTNFKNAEEFAKLAVGTQHMFHIEVESREWTNPNTGKTSWFTEVSCWRWDALSTLGTQPQPANDQYAAMGMQPNQQQNQNPQPQAGGDDLPF